MLAGAVVLAGLLVGVRLWMLHEKTSDWTLWPDEVPSKVQFAGREYNCGPAPAAVAHDVRGLTVQAATLGGAEILAEAPSHEARVFIAVRTAEGTFGCSLMGGP